MQTHEPQGPETGPGQEDREQAAAVSSCLPRPGAHRPRQPLQPTGPAGEAAFPFWRRNTAILAAGVFIAQIAFSMVAAFLPIYLQQLGLHRGVSLWAGMTFSVTSLTAAVMAPVWGLLADRHGKRIMLVRAGGGLAVTYFFMGLAHSHVELFLWRAVSGILSGFIPASIMLAATNTPENRLASALGAIQTASAVGMITGPLVGGAMAQALGIRGAFIGSACLLALATLVSALQVKEKVQRQEHPPTLMQGIRESMADPALRQLLLALLFVQSGVLMVQPTLPLLIARMNPQNVELVTGAIFSLVGLSTALGAPLVSHRVERSGAKPVFMAGLWLATVLSGLQGLAASVWSLAGIRFAFGFANAAIAITGNVLIATYSDPQDRGRNFGLLNSVNYLGAVLGPLLGGAVGEHLGLRASFFSSSAVLAVAALTALPLLRAGQVPAPAQAGHDAQTALGGK
ncbi:MAG: MFS transporter [Firmicutes bacterium]|nr:MFS transporter [Bacillota bacterium]